MILYLLLLLACVCTAQPQRFSAQVQLTYTQMTQAAQSARLTYDYAGARMALQYSDGYTEIYQFNNQYGLAATNPYQLQYVYKLAPQGACSPCAQYGLQSSFPYLNRTAWLPTPSSIARRAPTLINQGTVNGCTTYTIVNGSNFAASFSLNAADQLCQLTDRSGRLWTVVTGSYVNGSTTDLSVFGTVPANCHCRQPLDIAITLDRSASISVPGTYYYRAFLAGLASSFYFNATDTATTTQMGIVQWGLTVLPMTFPGSLNMTAVPGSVATATSVVGCTTQSACDFCYQCDSRNHCAAQGNTSDSECTTYFGTCAGCGLNGVQSLYKNLNYNNRSNARRIMIYITDGNANLDTNGNDCSRSGTPPCRSDILAQRAKLLSAVPDLVTYAIGINGVSGFDVSTATLNLISGDPSRTFVEPTFQSLVDNLQSYILGFCPLPDPIQECGSCCGFCECGQCVTPDTPLPLNGSQYCDGLAVTLTPGHCYEARFNASPCQNPPTLCDQLNHCDPTLPLAQRCVYQPLQCPTVACYENERCVHGECSGNYTCPTSAPVGTASPTGAPTPATAAPTQYPTSPGETFSPTGAPTQPACSDSEGYYCFTNAVCCPDRVSCCCLNNYTGARCGTPPDVDECQVDSDCTVADHCIVVQCQQTTPTQKRCVQAGPRSCDDGDACTHDYCDSVDGQCKHSAVVCNDNLQCTVDSCDSAIGCVFTPLDCSSYADICHDAACNDFAAVGDSACLAQSIVCPVDTNCTIAYCELENASSGGCVNQSYACDIPFLGIVAGITAGVIAGVTVAAAFIAAAGMASGAAVAVSQNYHTEHDHNVNTNPLYKQDGKCSEGLAH